MGELKEEWKIYKQIVDFKINIMGWITILLASIGFQLTELLISVIVRTIYLRFFNIQTIMYQFVGEFFGCAIAYFLTMKTLSWVNSDETITKVGILCFIVWNVFNLKIERIHYPIAQRLGTFLGITLVWCYLTYFEN